MRAMILAAGRGARMRPLTDRTPKPLLRVGEHRLIEHHLYRLAACGLTQVVINHAWLGEQIPAALGDGSRYGLDLHYSAEKEALETAGGLRAALPLLGDEPFLVMNGDVYTDWSPEQAQTAYQMLQDHPDALAYLWLVPNPPQHPQGDFSLTENGVVLPAGTNGQPTYTYSGIACFRPELVAELTVGEPAALAPLLHAAIAQQKVLGEIYTGAWHDIGTPERLAAINTQLAQADSPRRV